MKKLLNIGMSSKKLRQKRLGKTTMESLISRITVPAHAYRLGRMGRSKLPSFMVTDLPPAANVPKNVPVT